MQTHAHRSIDFRKSLFFPLHTKHQKLMSEGPRDGAALRVLLMGARRDKRSPFGVQGHHSHLVERPQRKIPAQLLLAKNHI